MSEGRRRTPWFWLLFSFLLLIVVFWAATNFLNALLLGSGTSLTGNNVLAISLSGPIVEQPARLFGDEPIGPLSVREIDTALRRAADDDRITAAVIRVGPLLTGFAKAQEMRSAIHAFRDSGKPVVARLEVGTLLDLYVASAASTVIQVPSGNFLLGMVVQRQYYRELLERFGVGFEAFHTGPYKTAMDTYTATGMSAAEREVIDTLLDDIYTQVVEGISSDRNLGQDEVRASIDLGLVSAAEALDAGLIDELGFDDAVVDRTGRGAEVSVRGYGAATTGGWNLLNPTIALVHVDGLIVPGNAGQGILGDGVAGGDRIARALREARATPGVRALVLRIDSPGGAVTASDVIWREVVRSAEDLPVIVSMSDVAASGGYWIATGASRVLADPATYTGSIGVVMGRFNLAGTYEKLGVGNAVVKRGANADLFLDSQPLSASQRERLQASVDTTYAAFLSKVAEARGLSLSEVEDLASGRVWTGKQGLALGLVDELGGLRTALSAARRAADIPAGATVTIEVFPRPPGLFEQVRGIFGVRTSASAGLPLADDFRADFELLGLLRRSGHAWALSSPDLPTAAH